MCFNTLALLTTQILASTIHFQSDFSTKIDGDLVSFTKTTIIYDLSRAKCPHASTHGADTWFVTLLYTFNNDFERTVTESIAYTPFPGAKQVYLTPETELQSGELTLWFRCSSLAGTTFDSDFGQNYHFKIQ